MSFRRVLPLALVALLLAAPLAAASGSYPPGDAPLVEVGGTRLAHWVGADPSTLSGEPGASMEVARGEEATLWLGLEKPTPAATNETTETNETNATEDGNATDPTEIFYVAYVNVTSEGLDLNESAIVRTQAMLSLVWDFTNVTFAIPESAPDNASYAFTVELYEERGENATLLGTATGEGLLTVLSAEVPLPPAAPGLPVGWIAAGAAVLVVGGGAAVVASRRRAERRRMNAAPRRSQVMREVELERKLERAKEKDPEQAVQIQQEIRQAERVRESRRELQILEAKRQDALKTLDLLKKRHEAGSLTKLQYDNMAAKKKADLARIEAEIASMGEGDESAAA